VINKRDIQKALEMQNLSLDEHLEPLARDLLLEAKDMLQKAIYHVVGDIGPDDKILTIDQINVLFADIEVNRHPIKTDYYNPNETFKIFTFLGDHYGEIIEDKTEPIPLIWKRFTKSDFNILRNHKGRIEKLVLTWELLV